MAILLIQLYMNNYFRRQSEASDWEVILSDASQRTAAATTDYLRMAKNDLIVMTVSGLLSLALFLFGLWLVGMSLIAL
jgi:hypothetical protein